VRRPLPTEQPGKVTGRAGRAFQVRPARTPRGTPVGIVEPVTRAEKLPVTANRHRMTGPQRREQLITVGRSLFAERGFEGTTVEEIAATAEVSKPVIYEHFGGKE